MPRLEFENRAVIVTGAGGGLGRCYALELAARGAQVVVNDTGTDRHGTASVSDSANEVVAEIRESGGDAVAVAESVERGARIVEAAMDHYGRIDSVVNNAGILRDRSFAKMTDEEWDAVYRVHLLGSYSVTHAAWPHLIESGSGRVVMTTSASGLYGNFGQANYAAAKMGVLGLVKTLAIEGARHGIRVNAIAPSAASRMTEDVIPPDWQDKLRPDLVAPVVVCLAHESCAATGQVFEASGGWVARVRSQRSNPVCFPVEAGFSPEQLLARWSELDDFEGGASPSTMDEVLAPIVANLSNRS